MKRYKIDISGFSDSDYAESVRMLTPEQYELISGIIDDLQIHSSSDYTPCIGIEEMRIRVTKKKEVEGKGTVIWCTDADELKIGTVITYNGVKFKVAELGEIHDSYFDPMERSVLLKPNSKVDKNILCGSYLEAEY